MENLGEALRNIDIFLQVLEKKMVDDNECSQNFIVEPIENLLRRKYIVKEKSGSDPLAKHLIPLPHVEEPLIDIFEDDDYVKVFMQYQCKDHKVTIHTDVDGLEICAERCRKINLPVKHLQIENMIVRHTNNEVLEIDIPKTKTTINYGN